MSILVTPIAPLVTVNTAPQKPIEPKITSVTLVVDPIVAGVIRRFAGMVTHRVLDTIAPVDYTPEQRNAEYRGVCMLRNTMFNALPRNAACNAPVRDGRDIVASLEHARDSAPLTLPDACASAPPKPTFMLPSPTPDGSRVMGPYGETAAGAYVDDLLDKVREVNEALNMSQRERNRTLVEYNEERAKVAALEKQVARLDRDLVSANRQFERIKSIADEEYGEGG